MTWKDVHSKLGEEKHTVLQNSMVLWHLCKKKKNPNWYLYRKSSGNVYSKVLIEAGLE